MRSLRLLAAFVTVAFLTSIIPTGQTVRSTDYDKLTQQRLAWLEKNAIKFKSTKFAKRKHRDLEALKEKIGDARIVLLGEQTHGHGTSHRMKCRLIKFLHEEMGFNVLAWESHMTGCRQMDEAFLNDADTQLIDLIDRGLYAVFGWPEQNRPLFEYIRDKRGGDNPIIQAGFDFQYSSNACQRNFAEFLSDFFNSAKAGLLPSDKVAELDIIMTMTNFYNITQSQVSQLLPLADYLLDLYHNNKNLLKAHYPSKEVAYLYRALLNFKLYTIWCSHVFMTPNSPPPPECHRDKVMADTLIFLAKEYFPNEKIIVWAASFHNMWNHYQIQALGGWSRYANQTIMGHFVKAEFGDELYSIAPITYEGESQFANGYLYERIPPAMEGSLSWYFHELGGKYYFLDMKSIRPTNWLHKNLLARPLSSYEFLKASWPEIFDAFVYIKKTTICRKDKERQ